MADSSSRSDKLLVAIVIAVLGSAGMGAIGPSNREILDEVVATRYLAGDTNSMHKHYDEDGVAMWFFPRSWGKTQDQILVELRTLTNTMQEMLRIMRSLAEKDG